MRLLDPGPGEVWDRLTILSLKIVHKGIEGRQTDHWQRERDTLISHAGGIDLRSLHDGSQAHRERIRVLLDLGAVNAALWQREDDLRRMRDEVNPDERWTGRVTHTAMAIQQLNDRRAELVTLINHQGGRPAHSEK